jgi:hypothetical protein
MKGELKGLWRSFVSLGNKTEDIFLTGLVVKALGYKPEGRGFEI